MCRFIESIKVEDQEVFLIDLHQKRVNDTFAHFEKEGSVDLQKIFKDLALDEDGLYKLRVSYNLEQNFTVQMIPYAIPEIEDFQVVNVDDLDYSFKYEDRKVFQDLKAKTKADEIIIVKNGYITDTSISNLIFFKNKEWFTPTTYLLNGVQRQHLLKIGKIKEIEITLDNIKEFSHFQMINAMNDFDDMFEYPLEKISNLPKDYRYMEL